MYEKTEEKYCSEQVKESANWAKNLYEGFEGNSLCYKKEKGNIGEGITLFYEPSKPSTGYLLPSCPILTEVEKSVLCGQYFSH